MEFVSYSSYLTQWRTLEIVPLGATGVVEVSSVVTVRV